jgi:hypothetical protein
LDAFADLLALQPMTLTISEAQMFPLIVSSASSREICGATHARLAGTDAIKEVARLAAGVVFMKKIGRVVPEKRPAVKFAVRPTRAGTTPARAART